MASCKLIYFTYVACNVTWQMIWTRKTSSLESRPAFGPSLWPSAKASYGETEKLKLRALECLIMEEYNKTTSLFMTWYTRRTSCKEPFLHEIIKTTFTLNSGVKEDEENQALGNCGK